VSTRRIAKRLDRLSTIRTEAEVQRVAQRIADREGIPVKELLAEAVRVAGVCQRQGITTVAGMIAYQANELGIPVRELEAEMERIRERVG